ncbi:autotransporter domain-containing protein [Variovorax sp. LjRoot175]
MSQEVTARTKLHAQIGWRRAFGNTMPIRAMSFADQTAFSVRGLPVARNVATLERGAETQWQPGATLWVVYAGQYASAFEDHSLRVQASWAF